MTKNSSEDKKASSLPTIDYLFKTYGLTSEEQKALRTFKMFESAEKLSRLKAELSWIKEGIVSENVLNKVVGKKKMSKFQNYETWAKYMLIWISEIKR